MNLYADLWMSEKIRGGNVNLFYISLSYKRKLYANLFHFFCCSLSELLLGSCFDGFCYIYIFFVQKLVTIGIATKFIT